MANFEKFTRGDYGLFAHCERKKDENGQYPDTRISDIKVIKKEKI